MAKTQTQIQLRREQWIKFGAFASLLIFGLIALVTVQNMLLSAILAFVISYLLEPLVSRLERRDVDRTIAISFVFMATGFLLGGLFSAIVPFISSQVSSFKGELPKYIEGVTLLMQDTEERMNILSGSLYSFDISHQVESTLVSFTSSFFEDLPTVVGKSLTTLLLAPFFAFFLLRDGRATTRKILNIVPNSIFELTLNLISQINDQIGQFIRARLLEAGIVGLVVWLGLAIIGFPYATLLALFAALMNLIPYVGPFIGAVPPIVIALINGETTLTWFLLLGVYFIAQLIDIVFIIPVVVAKIVDLHPVSVVFAIIVGAQLMGVIGMLISIPVASTLKVTITTVYNHLVDFRG